MDHELDSEFLMKLDARFDLSITGSTVLETRWETLRGGQLILLLIVFLYIVACEPSSFPITFSPISRAKRLNVCRKWKV